MQASDDMIDKEDVLFANSYLKALDSNKSK